jgi:hypothetical protein
LGLPGGIAAGCAGVGAQELALLNADPKHPSLQFKAVGGGRFHSVRVGLYYRALGIPVSGGVHWFWIGTHGEYDKLV